MQEKYLQYSQNAREIHEYSAKLSPLGVVLGTPGVGVWNPGEHAAEDVFQRLRAFEHIGAPKVRFVIVIRVVLRKPRGSSRPKHNFRL